MMAYYDRQGRPLTFDEYIAIDRGDYSVIAKTTVDEADADVSTVWLGLDHRHGPLGAPMIFETMAFGGGLDQAQVRYSTEAEAAAGHERMVQAVRDEAAAFAALTLRPEVADAVRLLEAVFAEHAEAHEHAATWDGALYQRAVKAVTR